MRFLRPSSDATATAFLPRHVDFVGVVRHDSYSAGKCAFLCTAFLVAYPVLFGANCTTSTAIEETWLKKRRGELLVSDPQGRRIMSVCTYRKTISRLGAQWMIIGVCGRM